MQITAKFASTCPLCLTRIAVGATVEWSRGEKARHVACPPAAAAPASVSAPAGVRHNQKPSQCTSCGVPLAAGEGHLYRCLGEASGCMKHYDEENGGWHVRCLDPAACKVRREEARAAAKREGEEAAARRAGEKRGEAFRAAEFAVEKAARTAGLVETMEAPEGLECLKSPAVASDHTGWYKCDLYEARTSDGRTAYLLTANGHDDWRTYYYVPRDVALATLDAVLARPGREITAEKATEWLSRYAKCAGADLYRRAAGLDPWPPQESSKVAA